MGTVDAEASREYARLITKVDTEGYAFWTPYTEGVIGDCGIVRPDGQFFKLFNVFAEGTGFERLLTAETQPEQMPTTDLLLQWPTTADSTERRIRNENNVTIWRAQESSDWSVEADVPVPLPVGELGFGFKFSTSKGTAAFLAPCGPTRRVATYLKDRVFTGYLKRNRKAIRARYSDEYDMSTIYILEGTTHATSWCRGFTKQQGRAVSGYISVNPIAGVPVFRVGVGHGHMVNHLWMHNEGPSQQPPDDKLHLIRARLTIHHSKRPEWLLGRSRQSVIVTDETSSGTADDGSTRPPSGHTGRGSTSLDEPAGSSISTQGDLTANSGLSSRFKSLDTISSMDGVADMDGSDSDDSSDGPGDYVPNVAQMLLDAGLEAHPEYDSLIVDWHVLQAFWDSCGNNPVYDRELLKFELKGISDGDAAIVHKISLRMLGQSLTAQASSEVLTGDVENRQPIYAAMNSTASLGTSAVSTPASSTGHSLPTGHSPRSHETLEQGPKTVSTHQASSYQTPKAVLELEDAVSAFQDAASAGKKEMKVATDVADTAQKISSAITRACDREHIVRLPVLASAHVAITTEMVICCTALLVSDPKATNWLAKERDKRDRKAQLKARHEALKTLNDMVQIDDGVAMLLVNPAKGLGLSDADPYKDRLGLERFSAVDGTIKIALTTMANVCDGAIWPLKAVPQTLLQFISLTQRSLGQPDQLNALVGAICRRVDFLLSLFDEPGRFDDEELNTRVEIFFSDTQRVIIRLRCIQAMSAYKSIVVSEEVAKIAIEEEALMRDSVADLQTYGIYAGLIRTQKMHKSVDEIHAAVVGTPSPGPHLIPSASSQSVPLSVPATVAATTSPPPPLQGHALGLSVTSPSPRTRPVALPDVSPATVSHPPPTSHISGSDTSASTPGLTSPRSQGRGLSSSAPSSPMASSVSAQTPAATFAPTNPYSTGRPHRLSASGKFDLQLQASWSTPTSPAAVPAVLETRVPEEPVVVPPRASTPPAVVPSGTLPPPPRANELASHDRQEIPTSRRRLSLRSQAKENMSLHAPVPLPPNGAFDHHHAHLELRTGRTLFPPPKPQVFYGRDTEINRIVTLSLDKSKGNARLGIKGTAGIGKTDLALAVLNDSRVRKEFGSSRVFLRCRDMAPEKRNADGLLCELALKLGLTLGGNILSDVITQLEKLDRVIIVLDALEAVWSPINSTVEVETERFMDAISSIAEVVLMVTVRGTALPQNVRWANRFDKPLGTLPLDAACAAFLDLTECEAAGSEDERASLDELLNAVDRHPQSVQLLARLNDPPSSLLKEWKAEHTELLQSDYHDGTRPELSVVVSIMLSIKMLPPPEHDEQPLKLLDAVRTFADGLPQDMQHDLRTQYKRFDRARRQLERHGLVQVDPNETLRSFAPLQHLDQSHLPANQ